MQRNRSNFRHYIKTARFLALGLLFGGQAMAQVSRAPANFVPDDDQILVPIIIERTILDEFHDRHVNDFKESRKKISEWIAAEEYAQAYGFENTGVVELPTPEEKQKFFERNYLRFLTKDVEKSAERSAKNWYENWTADDELASIEAQAEREKYLIRAKKKSGAKEHKLETEVKVGKSKVDFLIQPRIEMGMVKLRLTVPHFRAQAWLGVNGNQEVELEGAIPVIGAKAKLYYFIEQKRTLASIDQPLAKGLSLRLTHDRIDGDGIEAIDGETFENNVVQLRFGMGF